jgi:hypothetical protein
MKPHPRIRKTIKWGGAVMTVLMVVVWIGSRWWSVVGQLPVLGVVGVGGGQAFDCWNDQIPWSGAEWPRLDRLPYTELAWSFKRLPVPRYGYTLYVLPMWVPTCIGLLATIVVWRRDSRLSKHERIGRCPRCGYNRAGIGRDAACPECGNRPLVASEPTKFAPHA